MDKKEQGIRAAQLLVGSLSTEEIAKIMAAVKSQEVCARGRNLEGSHNVSLCSGCRASHLLKVCVNK